jgi:tRNA-dihydrouridine synthase B
MSSNETLPMGPEHPWLAPLAGFTDLPFRLLCREQGAAVACTEMVSAKGLVFGARQGHKGNQGTRELLTTCEADTPLVVQLFGAEPEFLAESVRILREWGYQWFDLNMGCSVPKVSKTGAGAAMLKDIPNALAAARAMIAEAGAGRVGFKMRLGWDADKLVYEDLGRALEDLGAGWLSLHPRYARQGFSGQADVRPLEVLAKAVSLPVLASGDLFTAQDALDRLPTGIRGVMFARGALHNPAVFRQYKERLAGRAVPEFLPAADLQTLILRHMALARELTPGKPGRKGYSPALLKMRTVVPRYVRHLPGIRHLRQALTRCESWEELTELLNDFFRQGDTQAGCGGMQTGHAGEGAACG